MDTTVWQGENREQMSEQDSRKTTDRLSVDQALGWIADIFEQAPATIRETTQRTDIAAWDSLGQLLLMAALDQRFGIRMTAAELSTLTSVRGILDLLAKHGLLRK